MSNPLAITLVVLWLAALTGCQSFPWHPFGSPITREASSQRNASTAKESVGNAIVEEVSKASFALDSALYGNPHALPVAKKHITVAKDLAAQIFGIPTVINEDGWKRLVERQTSIEYEVRLAANGENNQRLASISKLSQELDDSSAALKDAQSKLLDYARDKEATAGFFLKFLWVVGCLFAVYLLGQILQLIANFNPAFETASNVVNAIVSPALHSSASRARKALIAATE